MEIKKGQIWATRETRVSVRVTRVEDTMILITYGNPSKGGRFLRSSFLANFIYQKPIIKQLEV